MSRRGARQQRGQRTGGETMQYDRTAIEEVIYRSCLALDEKDFKNYLALCDSGFRYRITAHSPEIRKDMIWLEHDKPGLQMLFTNLPRHNSDHSPLTRHATVYTIMADEGQKQASVVSALQVLELISMAGRPRCLQWGATLTR
jgi:3-phenylpropionate/cinnamic acid dioxygenase small subunit